MLKKERKVYFSSKGGGNFIVQISSDHRKKIMEPKIGSCKFSDLSGTLIFSVLVASIGSGFQHGYNTGVLNNPEKVMKEWVTPNLDYPSSSVINIFWSSVVSVFCVGGMVGGALAGYCANSWGRRGALMANNVLVWVSAIVLGVTREAGTPYLLIVGRFIIGINCGLNAGLAPLYVNEISPTRVRGAMGSLYQLFITISILIAQLLGLSGALGSPDLWPLLLGLIGIIGLLQIIGLYFCPESPKYYLEKKHDEYRTRATLQKLLGNEYEDQFIELQKDIDDAKKAPKVTLKQMVQQKKLRMPLIIICVLMMAQQLTGINTVIFYSTQIFNISFSTEVSQYFTIGVGIINVLTTVVSVWLVEKFGRKPLLITAFGGTTVSMTVLFICLYYVKVNDFAKYLSIIMVYIYLVFFAIGAGSIPWLLGPELFNTAARPLAISIAVPTNWFFNFAVGLLFPPLQDAMGPAVFVIFIVCNICSLIFTWIFTPETKNRSIDEITSSFE